MDLNKQQQKVIDHKNGPLLIVAGAGTGKTTAITQKIVHAITKENIVSDQILAVTFTQKAAQEMLSRLDIVMPLGYEEPWLGTFHGMCDRILKDEALSIGLDSNYKVLTAIDQWILIKQNLFEFPLKYYRPLGNPAKFISAMISFFSKIQDEALTDQELDSFLKKQQEQAKDQSSLEEVNKYTELIESYRLYQSLKIKHSLIDFGDLIIQTINLFKTRSAILKKYQDKFKYIFIDEFQDTNYAQYELIKLLAPPKSNPNLIVVGDDDQSIYKFRGASVSNILGFKSDYPNSKEIVLSQNYRSPQNLLDAAYDLIQHNNPDRLEVKLNLSKKLTSSVPAPVNNLQIIDTPTSQSEVEYVITQILALVAKHNYTFKDFAILARANSQLQPFSIGLKRAGIPYQLVANRGLFDQPEIRQLINFLEVIVDPHDNLNIFEFLHFPGFDFSPSQILEATQKAKYTTTSLWNVIQEDAVFQPAVALIKNYQSKVKEQSTTQLLYDFIITSQFIQLLTSKETVENSLKIKNINLFFDKIKQFENQQPHSFVLEFIDTLHLWEDAGENPAQATIEDIDTVNLMTVHASKGLEYPVVFLVNLVAGRFPVTARKDAIEFPDALIKETLPEGKANLQEERRLMYVAMTRAKQYLFATYAKDYGGVRSRKPSGFLKETNIPITTWESQDQTTKLFSAPISPIITHLDETGQVEIKTLSYTQMDTFKGCPLKYKYRYILKIPTLPYHTLTFGRSVHETLYEFHRLAQQGTLLSQDEFIQLFNRHFSQVGYDNPKHKQERYQKAVKDLTRYYQHHQELFGKPVHLERSFKFAIDGVIINGQIDRIDQSPEGYEIVDYKTGQPKTQKQVDKDEQLSLYALATQEAMNITPQKLSLYFLESGDKVETKRTPDQLTKTKQKLLEQIQTMKNSNFPAKPDKIRCGFCEYNRICPFRADIQK